MLDATYSTTVDNRCSECNEYDSECLCEEPMQNNIRVFSGKSEAKGRNGYFALHQGEVLKSGDDTFVTFRSKRVGSADPILFRLTKEDATAMRNLLEGIGE